MGKFEEKETYLSREFKAVASSDFYRELFPAGSFEEEMGYHDEYPKTNRGNGFIVYQSKENKMHTRMIFDDLKGIENFLDCSTAFMSPIAYFGKNRTSANARQLFALVFDLDEVGEEEIRLLFSGWIDDGRAPRPTWIVNSGGGVHLYYQFEEPIPMYPNMQRELKNMKYDLTNVLWNGDTSQLKTKQYQGINQGFRLVGSRTKHGEFVTAYKTGKKVTLEYLNQFVSEENRIKDTLYHPKMTLEEAKKKYPEWYEQRIVHGRSKMNWTCNRSLYDWWKSKDYLAQVHHRYFYIMCLTIYAMKCGIDFEELKADAYSLIERFNHLDKTNPFTEYDVDSALEMYQECYRSFPRDEISKVSGIEIKPNKRNGRKQDVHLQRARAVQKIDYPNNEWAGRKSVQEAVFKFLDMNPKATLKDFQELTGMSKATFFKYKKLWQSAQDEALRKDRQNFALASMFDSCIRDAQTGEPVNISALIAGLPPAETDRSK